MAVDQLHTETDRQLAQQRSHADALATRAGLLIAVSALLTRLPAQEAQTALEEPLTWVVGVTMLLGVIVLTTVRITAGPTAVQIIGWSNESSPHNELLKAKLVAIEANNSALGRSDSFFWLQAVGTAIVAFVIIFKI